MGTILANPKGTNLSRYLIALILADGERRAAADYARKRWADSPAVYLTLEHRKTAVDPGTTYDDSPSWTWGSELAAYGIAQELLELVRGVSVLGRLNPFMRATPFRTRVPRETTAATAGWVSESEDKPAAKLAYDDLQLEAYKSAIISVISQELARMSTPAAEAAIRNSLVASIASFLDAQFLDVTVALVAGDHPASVANGAQTVNSTGPSSAQILTDLNGMIAKLAFWTSPFWVMKPATAAHIAASSSSIFPEIRATPDGGYLAGIPVINSTNSPAQITLLDASDILYADDGATRISLSGNATVELDTAPGQGTLTSLWQKNLVGIKVEREISWLRGHDTSVVSMTVAY